jgi:hypothetical protein
MSRHRVTLVVLLVCLLSSLALGVGHRFGRIPPKRGFYYWKTEWSASPAILRGLSADRIDRTVAGIDSVLAFTRTASTPFDRWLAATYDYAVEELHELRALNVLCAGDLTNALAEFQQAGERAAEPLPADPEQDRYYETRKKDTDPQRAARTLSYNRDS